MATRPALADADRDRLVMQLMRHEGLKLRPYRDTVGKLTIGIGRNLDDVGISLVEAQVLCDNDIARAYGWLTVEYREWFPALNAPRQVAIVNMVFNLGPHRFSDFHDTIAALASGRYARAAEHMLASTWARQVGSRATELAAMVRTGEWVIPA